MDHFGRRKWKITCNIKDLIYATEDEDDETILANVKKITDRLDILHLNINLDREEKKELFELLHEMNNADSVDEANGILDSIYDWADGARVWLGL